MDKNESVANAKRLERNAANEAKAFLEKYPAGEDAEAIRNGSQVSS